MTQYLRKLRKSVSNPRFILYGFEGFFERVLTLFWIGIFRLKCALLGIHCGKNLLVFGRCIIRKYPLSTISIGNGVIVVSSSWRSSTANCHNSKLRTFSATSSIILGNNSGMTGGVIISRSKTISIGERCMLAPGVVIMDSDWHIPWPPEKRHSTWETDIDKDVTLEENVWVGINVTILKGVTIGKNSVIAAGSIVINDIPANCLAGGSPATVLKQYK
jgi:acetyltransferase-like isoleucine patch superfamily enzyme